MPGGREGSCPVAPMVPVSQIIHYRELTAQIAGLVGVPRAALDELTMPGRYGNWFHTGLVLRRHPFTRSLRCSRCGRAGDLEHMFMFVCCCMRCDALLTDDPACGPIDVDPEIVAAQAELLRCVAAAPQRDVPGAITEDLRIVAWAASPTWPRRPTNPLAPASGVLAHGDEGLEVAPPWLIAPFLPWLSERRRATDQDPDLAPGEAYVRSLYWPFAPTEAPTSLEDLQPARWPEVLDKVAATGMRPEHVPLLAWINPHGLLPPLRLAGPRAGLAFALAVAAFAVAGTDMTYNNHRRLYGWNSWNSVCKGLIDSAPRAPTTDFLCKTAAGRAILLIAVDALADAGLVDRAMIRDALRPHKTVPARVLARIPTITPDERSGRLAAAWIWAYATHAGTWWGPMPPAIRALQRFDRQLTAEGRLILAEHAQALIDPYTDVDLNAAMTGMFQPQRGTA